MSSWDCYCAICGGPFTFDCELSKRRCKPHFKQKGRSISFTLTRLTDDDVAWTETLHVIGWVAHGHDPADGKAFVSGPGRHTQDGEVEVKMGDDPTQPGTDFAHCCYGNDLDEDREDTVFPFHWCCFELLLRAISGTPDITNVNKDILWKTMARFLDGWQRLEIPYGTPDPPQEDFWEETKPGQEIFLMNPTETWDLENWLREFITRQPFQLPSVSSEATDIQSRVLSDPFTQMPYDILHELLRLAPTESVTALCRASWVVHASVRHNHQFWKLLIRRSMPWFFELHRLLDDEELMRGKDLKALFLWLDRTTTPRLMMISPFISVANRRRIWGVCEFLTERYHDRLAWEEGSDADPCQVARTLKQNARYAKGMAIAEPFTLRQSICNVISTQWVRALGDIVDKPGLFEAFWDDGGSLVGLAVSFSETRRLFGKDDSGHGVVAEAFMLESSDWIHGIVVHTPAAGTSMSHSKYMRDGSNDETEFQKSIKGITVICHSGERNLRCTDAGHNTLAIIPNKGWSVLGVAGRIDRNGHICDLDLLQCPGPARNGLSKLPFNSENLFDLGTIWHKTWNGYPHYGGVPIWADPSLKLVFRSCESFTRHPKTTTADITFQTLILAESKNELRKIKRISSCVVKGGHTNPMGPEVGMKFDELVGVRVEYVDDTPMRCIGMDIDEEVLHERGASTWKEDNMVHLDIDGPGGEEVTRMDYDTSVENSKLLKLYTNWEQELSLGVCFGLRPYHPVEPADQFIGLAVSFGIKSGFDSKFSTYSHISRLDIGCLVKVSRVETPDAY